MSVKRHRDVSEIPDPPRAESAYEGLKAACDASNISSAFGHVRRMPRGVYKFRSVEEADAFRQQWESGHR